MELALLGSVFAVYAAAFAVFNSRVVQGTRFFPLFDDAMISMRYAKNLAAGQGLRFNAGEAPVEGFSDPAWTFLMAAVIKVTGPSFLSLAWMKALSLLAHLVSVGFAWGFCREAFPERPRVRFFSTLCYAISLPALYWAEMGMETGLQAALLTAGVWAAWRALEEGRAGWALPLLGFFGPLCRLDLALTLTVVVLTAAWQAPAIRRSLILRFGLLTAFGLGLQTGLRWCYYSDLLPNTYYLKMTGLPLAIRLGRGLLTLWDMAARGWILLALLGCWGAFKASLQPRVLIVLAPLLAAIGAHVWVGGDAWEGQATSRFLVQAAFFAYFCSFLGVAAVIEAGATRASRWTAVAVGALLALACAWVVETDQDGGLGVGLLQKTALDVNSDIYLASVGALCNGLAPQGASWAMLAIGNFGYFTDARVVDLLGKCDPVIARLPARPLFGDRGIRGYVPGHTKLDYAWSLGHEKPDMVQFSLLKPEEAQPYLQKDYRQVSVLDGRFWFYCRQDKLGALHFPAGAHSISAVPPLKGS